MHNFIVPSWICCFSHIISSYHHIRISSFHHITKWLKSFLVPSPGFRHILSRLPLLQGSLPKNKGSWGNNFLRRICWGGSKSHSSSKTSPFQKKNGPRRFLQKKNPKKKFRRRKMKNCKSSETRFAKVSRRSEPCSGGKRPFEVSKKNRNSRVDFRKGNVSYKNRPLGPVLMLRYLV